MAVRDLPAGTVLAKSDLTFLRPRTGFPPSKELELIGQRLIKGVQRGEPLLPEHLA
jgi:sialic acid synthase SpsE